MKFLDKRSINSIDKRYKQRDEIFRSIKDALRNDDLENSKLLIEQLHYADIADLIDDLEDNLREKTFNILGDGFDSEILVKISPETKNSIAEIIGAEVFAQKIDNLDTDKAVSILENLTTSKQTEILSYLCYEKQDLLNRSLSYPENTAGRMMDRSVVAVSELFNITQTLDYLKNTKNLPNDFYEIFVIDKDAKIIGGVLLSRLLRIDPDESITSIMDSDIIVVNTHTDQEEISYLFKQYSLIAIPVVNNENILVGIIAVGDIIEVIEEETEEDIRKMVGVSGIDFHADKIKIIKERFPWLFINLLTACLTSMVISIFTNTIESLVALAAIMPIVASLVGNAGSQTLTVAVRAIANRELNINNLKKTILKEIFANCANGIFLAIFGGILIFIWQKNMPLSLVFSAAIVISFSIAGFLGAFIPIILTRMNTDPAVSSTVFLTALTDLIGFFTFLGLASLFLIN